MFTRIMLSITMGATATFVLFLVMQALVDTGEAKIPDDIEGRTITFAKVKDDTVPESRRKKPERPDQPEAPPPTEDREWDDPAKPPGPGIPIKPEKIDDGVGNESFNPLGGSDGDYLPVVKVQPSYPRRAAARGLEGYVLLEFTVTELGTVKDPRVIDARPPGYFERAAIEAVLKFKYKARIVNGQPIAVTGVQNRITFTLEDG